MGHFPFVAAARTQRKPERLIQQYLNFRPYVEAGVSTHFVAGVDPQQPDANDCYPGTEMQVTDASRWRGGAAQRFSKAQTLCASLRSPPANRLLAYLAPFVVYQICGAPFTPPFSIAALSSGNAANALAFSRLRNSWITVTSFGSSVD